MTDLTTRFLEFTLPTPLVLASGIWGTTVSLLERAALAGCGAVTAKSCGPTPRAGARQPLLSGLGARADQRHRVGESGRSGRGRTAGCGKAAAATLGVPLIASIFAGPPEEFGTVAATVAAARPDLIEVNISCPMYTANLANPTQPAPTPPPK
jgi:dihydroorotate dehydrogenase (NAD+) catalytic subunit